MKEEETFETLIDAFETRLNVVLKGIEAFIKNGDIPVSGRLMAVADVYDALISKRVYKPPFSHSKAVAIIEEGRGDHFDPEMVDAFLELQEEFRRVALEFADFDEEREALLQ